MPEVSQELISAIYSRLGSMEGQNELILRDAANARKERHELYGAVDSLRVEVAASAHNAVTLDSRLEAIEPDVAAGKHFRAQLAVMVFVVTSAVTGAINLIWLALSNMSSIKDALRAFLRH